MHFKGRFPRNSLFAATHLRANNSNHNATLAVNASDHAEAADDLTNRFRRAVVEVLLRSGFDVNCRTKAGTPLHEAALCGKVEVVRTLLDHGADISITNSHDFTVADLLGQFPAQATHEIMSILKCALNSSVFLSFSVMILVFRL